MTYEVVLFWFGLIGVLGYLLLHVAYIALHYPFLEWSQRLFASSSYPVDSLLVAVYEDALAIARRWKKRQRHTIRSPRLRYRLETFLASGDLCDSHLATANAKEFVLKLPRSTQGEPLLRREMEILGDLHSCARGTTYAKYLPFPFERFRHDDRYISAIRFEPGFMSARELRSAFPCGLDGPHIAWMWNRTLEVLGFVHQCGIVHAGVLPTHLLFHSESHAGKLIGWTHAVRQGQVVKAVPGEYRSWYPDECVRKEGVCPATDIYLAAATMLWLSGGDVETKRFSQTIPRSVQEVLSHCLEHHARDRPSDAWGLHRRLKTVWEYEYGTPKFQELWT